MSSRKSVGGAAAGDKPVSTTSASGSKARKNSKGQVSGRSAVKSKTVRDGTTSGEL
jgi:hypothetical protein